MKKIILIAIFCLITQSVFSEEVGFHLNSEAKPFPTLKDLKIVLAENLGAITFYGQNRSRWYLWSYPDSEPFDNNYDHYANQLRLGTRFENDWLKIHAAWQYVVTWLLPSGASAGAGSGALYYSNGTAQNSTHGTYLKYAEIQSKDFTGTGITVGGGRMDYSSGNRYIAGTGKGVSEEEADSPITKKIQWLKSTRIAERVIGGIGWSEYQRSFDGGYAVWDHEFFNFQFAAMNPTQGGFDENANHSIPEIDLLASELTIKQGKWLPNTEFQLFYYNYHDGRQMLTSTARRDNTGRTLPAGLEYDVDVQMIGGHLAGASTIGQGTLDYLLWGGYQDGDWFELDHSAYSFAAEVGYQWKDAPWKPWIRAGYNIGSGDEDAEDSDHNTFFQMLPTARLYSFSILYNLMNTEDLFASLILKPIEPLTIRTEAHWIDLSEKADRWYLGSGEITDGTAAGYAVRSSSGESNLGTLLDISVAYKLCPQATVSVYYGHFFGSQVAESFYTKDSDANLFFTELNLSF